MHGQHDLSDVHCILGDETIAQSSTACPNCVGPDAGSAISRSGRKRKSAPRTMTGGCCGFSGDVIGAPRAPALQYTQLSTFNRGLAIRPSGATMEKPVYNTFRTSATPSPL